MNMTREPAADCMIRRYIAWRNRHTADPPPTPHRPTGNHSLIRHQSRR
jgi:hypothetical protein